MIHGVREVDGVQGELLKRLRAVGVDFDTRTSPERSRRRDRDRSHLIHSLEAGGVTTLAELDALLASVPKALTRFKALMRKSEELTGEAMSGFPEDVLNLLVFVTWGQVPAGAEQVYTSETRDGVVAPESADFARGSASYRIPSRGPPHR